MTFPLHGYQKSAVDWMLKRQCGYLAIDMGLGKTRIVLEYIRQARIKKTLVVAPLRVALHTWPSEIQKWAPELTYTVLHGQNKSMRPDVNIYIINYEGLKWLMEQPKNKLFESLLVIDEASMVKSPSSLRFKILSKLRSFSHKVFALSASPMPNGYQDLWAQYFLLDRGKSLGPSFAQFFNKYFRRLSTFQTITIDKQALQEIPKRVASATFRLSSNDYLALPKCIMRDTLVELPKTIMIQYKEFEQDFALNLSQEVTVTAVNSAMLSMRLRQLCQGFLYYEGDDEKRNVKDIHSVKVDALVNTIQELNGHPALVAVQFKEDIVKIKKALGNVPIIAGGVGSSVSTSLIDKWNTGQLPILVVHPASISHGVNLQYGGNNIIWYAQTWNMEHYQQLNGRLLRQGQKKPVIITRLLAKGTIEHKIIAALAQKNESQQSLLDALRKFTNELLAQS